MRAYLGRGVYVDVTESGGVVLLHEHCAIHLDPHAFNALLQYVEHLGGASPTTGQRQHQTTHNAEPQKAERNHHG